MFPGWWVYDSNDFIDGPAASAATAAGYVAQSLLIEYVTLAVLAAFWLVFYL